MADKKSDPLTTTDKKEKNKKEKTQVSTKKTSGKSSKKENMGINKSSDGNNRALIIIIAIVAVTLICCIVCAIVAFFSFQAFGEAVEQEIETIEEEGESGDSAEGNNGNSDSGSEEAEQIYSQGEAVEIEGISWRLDEATDQGATLPSAYEFLDDCNAEEGNRFVVVKLTVTNASNQPETIFEAPQLQVAGDKTYEYAFTGITNCVDSEINYLPFVTLNPDASEQLQLYYQIPEGGEDFTLNIPDQSVFSDEEQEATFQLEF
jgi:hypothetical protein